MLEKILQLQYAIPDGQGGITQSIKLGRMKLKHLKTLPKSLFDNEKKKKNLSMDEIIPVLAGLTNMPENCIEEIDMVDLEKIGEELSNFLSESLGSGKNSSGE